jgi:hypothetical protein
MFPHFQLAIFLLMSNSPICSLKRAKTLAKVRNKFTANAELKKFFNKSRTK